MTRLSLLLSLLALAACGGQQVPYTDPLAPYAGAEYWYSAQPGSLAAPALP
jgi:hypothetical protein